VNPSPTLTTPLATRCFFRLNVTLLEWAVLTVKFVALVAVPPGVVTLILPVVAPVGTVAVICVAEFTVNEVAVVVLNFTEVVEKPVPLKFVPVILTDVPTGPKVGVNEVIVGTGATTKSVALVAVVLVLKVFVTVILPVVAPVGTVAVIDVAEFNVKVALMLLNLTAVVQPKFVPVMLTVVPMGPFAGVKVVMVGAAGRPAPTTKTEALNVSAPGVTTSILPVVAAAGTDAVADVSLTKASFVEETPLNCTSVMPVNPVPVIVTAVPVGPHVGVKLVTVDADAGRAVSPTINVTPTSETNTRTDARLPECRPKCFMVSTSLSPPLGMERCSISPIEPELAYHSWTPRLAVGPAFPAMRTSPRWNPTTTFHLD
jgi:hypothetical protein